MYFHRLVDFNLFLHPFQLQHFIALNPPIIQVISLNYPSFDQLLRVINYPLAIIDRVILMMVIESLIEATKVVIVHTIPIITDYFHFLNYFSNFAQILVMADFKRLLISRKSIITQELIIF